MGIVSGGHLVALLGTMDGKGDASDSDPVNRLSAKVQAVVALFAFSALMLLFSTMARSGTPGQCVSRSASDRTISRIGSIVTPHH